MTFIFHFCFLLEVEDTPRGRDVPSGLRLDCVSSVCGRAPSVGVSPGVGVCPLGYVLSLWACPLCGGVSPAWTCPLGACLQCGHVPGVGVSLVWGRVLWDMCCGACPRMLTLDSFSKAADAQS